MASTRPGLVDDRRRPRAAFLRARRAPRRARSRTPARASRGRARAQGRARSPSRASRSAGSTRRGQGMRPPASQSALSPAGTPGTAHDAGPTAYSTTSSPKCMGRSRISPTWLGTATKQSRRPARLPSHQIACPPPRSPVITVSATHAARPIATTASAAVPPSPRISAPTPAVAVFPAATPARITIETLDEAARVVRGQRRSAAAC